MSILKRRITSSARDLIRAAIASGELGHGDRRYLLDVLAPGIADLVDIRAKQAVRRKIQANRRAVQPGYAAISRLRIPSLDGSGD